ncbi:Carbohydrate-selective porin OprB [Syntrophobacter sp. SbD1]|nr:Carbohydrate-selective porin OprB [Syntrophobacter sp. SbD1]
MTKNAALALVFVCLVFPFTCTAEESRLEPVETVQLEPDQRREIKAEPSEGAGPLPVEDPAKLDCPVADSCQDCSEQKSQECPDWVPKLLGAQYNVIYQDMPPFHSPYEGQNSLSFRNGLGEQVTQTYGVYFGSQLAPGLQAYADGEFFQGNGISDGLGLAGYVNGDVIRAGSSNLPKIPYLAKLYLRYYYPLSGEAEKLERCMDQLPGEQPVSRWEIKIGKLAATDDFDLNRYANNNRAQFFNYDFLYNTAWDYAADTRGYSYGIVTSLFPPRWRVAFGVYMEPDTANGADFDFIDLEELGYNLELTWKPNDAGTVVRLLSYFNEGRLGSYDAALTLGRTTSTVPDLLLVEQSGGTKYGFGLNFEQPMADDGETGIFGRIGWNDGNHESWSYVESDRHASFGAQVSGIHWTRPDDRLGVAYGVNGLSDPHKNYLEAGGIGILLGDGKLNYGLEQALELYYRIQVCRYVQISPDFQFIQDPGYNRDRGPVEVYGLRLRVSF